MAGEELIHGELIVRIDRCKNLYNGEILGVPIVGRVLAKCLCFKSDPYVNIKLGDVKLGTTSRLKGTLKPKYNEEFTFKLCHNVRHTDGSERVINLEVKDKNFTGAMMLGHLQIPLDHILNSKGHTLACPRDGWKLDDRHKERHGRIFATLTFNPYDHNAPDSLNPAVPDAYFVPVPGNHMRLYQSAANTPDTVPPYMMPSGERWPVHPCWRDLYDAIKAAQKFIYITGWSVHPECKLVRDKPERETIGELLREAADRGVDVRLLVWDDRSSVSVFGRTFMGAMTTFDEQCRKWFAEEAPKVKCVIVNRVGHEALSLLEGATTATCFSHHQKTVILDIHGRGGREASAFVGGLDITKGRYDDAYKHLYPTDGRYMGDWNNSSFSTDMPEGSLPRQPWQDIHCQIHGPAALDVAMNFVERWTQQVDTNVPTPEMHGCEPSAAPEEDKHAFTVQVLRSIDSQSAALDLTRQDKLFKKVGINIDHSIALGYVHHVRRAERFIYIENQYFYGSCYMWAEAQDCGCNHTIQAEITEKICRKIARGERFVAYITTPMYPEGSPTDDSVQAILRFQRLTRETMYRRIAGALQAAGSSEKPTDYLVFFCLGNRESGPKEPPQPANGNNSTPKMDAPGVPSGVHRRHMVYVHSKFMVVDDEIAIIGSANINMRSLAGDRDTELSVALWQPHHLMQRPVSKDAQTPLGAVHAFRMSVWAEHLANGNSKEGTKAMMYPSTLESVRRVWELAADNWKQYNAEENNDLAGHLMTYPFEMRDIGVTVEPSISEVPDFPGASFAGKDTILPDVLCT